MANRQRFDNIFNVSFDRWEFSIAGGYYIFEPRGITKVPEEITWIIESEHKKKGLIVVSTGDDFKAKEREGLINYLETLKDRIQNYQSEWDELKRHGVTPEESSAWKRAKRWREEIIKKLNIEAPLEEEKSFFNKDDLKNDVFSKEFTVESTKDLAENNAVVKKRGRPAKNESFLESDITSEIGI